MPLISVGTIIDRTWNHYTKHFIELMSISAWILILAIFNIFSSWLSPDTLLTTRSGALSPSEVVGLILYIVTFFLIAPILSVWISNRLIKGVDSQLAEQQLNSKTLDRFGWKYFFPRLLVGILSGLLIIVPLLLMAPGGLLSVVAATLQSGPLSVVSTALIFFGVIAALAGSIYMLVRLSFSSYALIIDDKRGKTAIKTSLALTKNRWWAICFRIVIPAIVFYFGLFTVQTLVLYILRTVILSLTGLNVNFAVQLYNIGSGTVFILLSMLVTPLLIISNSLAYQSVKNER